MLSTRQLYRSNNQPASYAALTQFAPEPFIVQEVDPDLFQHGERRLMDRFELVARNKLDRLERRLWLARRPRRAGRSAPLGRAPAAAPGFVVLRLEQFSTSVLRCACVR